MIEHPILFTTPMIKAILAKQKTMTRRVVELRKGDTVGNISEGGKVLEWIICDKDGDEVPMEFACPYGVAGDRLWVRETWATAPNWDDVKPSELPTYPDELCVFYKSTGGATGGKWRPSIFMPRWASRITLKITDVRIERVQSISQEDAVSEGMTQRLATELGISVSPSEEEFNFTQARRVFIELWDHLNKKRGFGYFDVNPFVWVITFRKVNS